jgi:hypothetical protein
MGVRIKQNVHILTLLKKLVIRYKEKAETAINKKQRDFSVANKVH